MVENQSAIRGCEVVPSTKGNSSDQKEQFEMFFLQEHISLAAVALPSALSSPALKHPLFFPNRMPSKVEPE